MVRHFNPRSPIPKQKLLDELNEGKTLQEIGDKYNRSKSYVSECIKMYDINLDEIEGREEKKLERRRSKAKQSFVDVMYNKIEKEISK